MTTPIWLNPTLWVLIGFTGQAIFMSRMLVQWIAAERKGDSVVPNAFWWLSLAGGLITFAYAVYKYDPVIMFAQAMGSFVYVRNLMLISRKKTAQPAAEADESPRLTIASNEELAA
jgi:lipid-A-disaccharide synthase-like uncharacterized protein